MLTKSFSIRTDASRSARAGRRDPLNQASPPSCWTLGGILGTLSLEVRPPEEWRTQGTLGRSLLSSKKKVLKNLLNLHGPTCSRSVLGGWVNRQRPEKKERMGPDVCSRSASLSHLCSRTPQRAYEEW